jgi:hypothetical protein
MGYVGITYPGYPAPCRQRSPADGADGRRGPGRLPCGRIRRLPPEAREAPAMTERKPPGVSCESFVDRQIREA